MKMRFCPQCASLEVSPNGLGGYRCRKCHYSGEIREGSVDELNALKKRVNDRNKAKMTVVEEPKPKDIRPTDLRARNLMAKKIAPKKTDDWEII
ncbi:MAG: hypothetical protein V1494_02090 [Candidatus Diapherotrites archaeon]